MLNQDQSLMPSPHSQTNPQQQPEILNLTQMLHSYVYNMGLSDNAQNITQKLDSLIAIRTSEIPLEAGLQPTKSLALKNALEAIKANYLSWQAQLDNPDSAQLDTPDSIKQKIKETLKCYQKYFLSKFSSDGSIRNCDQDIKDIFLNFDENSRFISSINDARDKNSLNRLLKFLNNYLIELTLATESKIKDEQRSQKQEDIDKIKAILLTFPGGSSSESSRIQFACIDGTIERIQEAIFALSDCSIESRLIKERIETASAKFATLVRAGNQVHLGPCLLASLMIDRKKIAEIDSHFTSPQQDMLLEEVISFGYNFVKTINDKLLQTRENLLREYSELFELARENEAGVKIINYHKLMEFVERSKYSGFAIDDIYGLFNDEVFFLESDEIDITKLLTLEQLKAKYFQIPTPKFKEELLKAQQSITQSSRESGLELELALKYDYLYYLPNPEDLFKVETIAPGETVITDRLDPQKIENLLDLLLGNVSRSDDQEIDESQTDNRSLAGLIALRNLFDGYETNDELYFYFLRFNSEFTKKTGSSFVDFFYEDREGVLSVRSEFEEVKPILETIKSRVNYLNRLFYTNIEEARKTLLKELSKELLLIIQSQGLQDSQEAIIIDEQYHDLKNGLDENFLQILYQFDAEIFRKVLEGAPGLVTQIVPKNNQGLSLVQILAKAGDKESLCFALKKYKEIISPDALIALINNQELLFDIVRANRFDILEKIFEIAGDRISSVLNKLSSNGYTILLIACEKGYTKIALALINANADLNKQPSGGTTALYIACQNGHTEIVDALIEAKANLNKPHEETQTTPLFTACQNGHTKIVELLIKAGANLNKPHIKLVTPLFIACQMGHSEIVKLLINAGVDLNQASKNGATPLFIACQKGHPKVVKLLIDEGVDLNQASKDGITPLYIACQNGHTEIVNALIKAKADLDKHQENGSTPLLIACNKGHTEIVKALIKAKADLNKPHIKLVTPLFIACQEGHTEIVNALINAKADLDKHAENGATPLFIACQEGHTEIVKALIEAGADLNQANKNDATPLYVACQNGHPKVVKLLIDAGVDLNIAYNLNIACNSITPLLIAIGKGHDQLAEALFDAGANIDSSNFSKYYRYFLFSFQYNSPRIKELIKKFSNPERIKFRDQTLERAKISKRQAEFNDNARLELNLQAIDNPGQRASTITEKSKSFISEQDHQLTADFKKEFINALLFLKFVAIEFSSQEKSILTSDEKISQMLKIYLSGNRIARDMRSLINSVAINKNGLQDFLKNASYQELIELCPDSQPEIPNLEFAQTNLEQKDRKKKQEILDQIFTDNVGKKLKEIITAKSDINFSLTTASGDSYRSTTSSLPFAEIGAVNGVSGVAGGVGKEETEYLVADREARVEMNISSGVSRSHAKKIDNIEARNKGIE